MEDNKNMLKNPMLPLWIKYPNIPHGSIGWRMGYGESYAMEFSTWFYKLSDDEKSEYKKLFPEPKMWSTSHMFKGIKFWNREGIPQYDLKDLINDYKAGKHIKYIFFWGHQPSPNGEVTKSCFSQWFQSDFYEGHIKYFCMEQYMMAKKAILFGDEEIKEEIMNSKHPKQIKALGRKVKNFNEDVWNKYKYSIVLNGNYAKFTQNEEFRHYLIETKKRVLVEASPYDNIWGIKMSKDDSTIENPCMWKGNNLLGFALMEVRDEIIRVYKNK